MNANNAFSLFAGLICGLFIVFLFNEKARTVLTNRSQWMAENPRAYTGVIIVAGLVLLGVAYVLAKRFP